MREYCPKGEQEIDKVRIEADEAEISIRVKYTPMWKYRVRYYDPKSSEWVDICVVVVAQGNDLATVEQTCLWELGSSIERGRWYTLELEVWARDTYQLAYDGPCRKFVCLP